MMRFKTELSSGCMGQFGPSDIYEGPGGVKRELFSTVKMGCGSLGLELGTTKK